MKKIVIIFWMVLWMPRAVFSMEWDQGDLYARSAILADGETGRILYEENGSEFRSIASTTKIMTAILILELGDPAQICTVSSYAASMPNVKLGLRPGEQYYMKDLLYAVMLESSNDAAVVVAEGLLGTVEGFASAMNRKAKEIGAMDSVFVTPNGLDAPGQGSTGKDLAKIAVYAIQNPEFCDLIRTRNHTFSSVDGKRTFSVNNKNSFLDQMEGAFGIKTGYTGEAGYCFVGALRDGDRIFVSVVLGSSWPPDKNAKWKDTKKLMNYGLSQFEMRELPEIEEIQRVISVKNGVRDLILVKGNEKTNRLVGKDETVTLEVSETKGVHAPIEPGQIAGWAKVVVSGEIVHTMNLKTDSRIAVRNYDHCLREVFWKMFSFCGI